LLTEYRGIKPFDDAQGGPGDGATTRAAEEKT
jgi:hypothetical protein